jgi:hypothetical protein
VNPCPLWVRSGHWSTSNQCLLYPQKRTLRSAAGMSASLIGRLRSSASGYPRLRRRHHSRARASLRTRRKALPSWDPRTRWNNLSGDLTVGRSKRTCELTSSIVPRGTSFHRLVELEFPPIAFDPERSSRCSSFSGPSELGAISPDAMHNDGQASR